MDGHERVIRTRTDDDAVLPRIIHGDECTARCRTSFLNGPGVDAFAAQIFGLTSAEIIFADAPEERDIPAGPCGGECLVRSLPAKASEGGCGGESLARCGDVRNAQRVVHIQ
jgi:hypothetical protein